MYLIRKELLGDRRFVHIEAAIPSDSDCSKIVLRLNDMELIVICHCLLKRQSINEARSVLYGILSTLVIIPRMQPA